MKLLCILMVIEILATSIMANSPYERYFNRENRQLFVTMPATTGVSKPTESSTVHYVPLSQSKLSKHHKTRNKNNSFSKSTIKTSDMTTESNSLSSTRNTRMGTTLDRSTTQKIQENGKAVQYQKSTKQSSMTSPMTPDDVTPIPQSTKATREPLSSPDKSISQGGKDQKTGDDQDKPRSALIGIPSRDPQVIFLADDPEAAAKIPSLLSTLGRTHSIRVTPPSSNYYSTGNHRITRPENGFTLLDLQNSVRNTLGHTLSDSSTASTIIVEGRKHDDNDMIYDIATGRHRNHPSRNKFNIRRPFGDSPSTVDNYKKKYTAPFARTSPGGSLARQSVNMTRVTHIEAECQDDYMRIHTQFNGSFDGLVYSAGYAYDRYCIYVNGSGRNVYDFHIQLNRCGTLGGNEQGDIDIRGRPTQKNMMWNTLTVQYNPLIEEEWDEHFKVTCEYGYDFWKTVTFPFLDVEVQTGNPVVFTLTPPECHMEIRYGYGTSGQRINGPVRVGDPLTLVIYMRSELDGFDIVVSDCFAHNGGSKKISLIDHYGCPVDEKLISHFEGSHSDDGHYETQVYAFMKTFRFTGSPALYIECDVRMCHGECPPQPCHWKRNKRNKRDRRSVDDTSAPGNVSDTLNLFQSIEVLRDDESSSSQNLHDSDVCFKNETFSAAAGGTSALLLLLLTACLVMCSRVRKVKKGEKRPKPTLVENYNSDFVPPKNRRLD